MFQFILDLFGSAYFEIVILIALLIASFTHRRDPRLVVSGIRLVRTVIVVLIFFYFMFIWSSTVQPTLRSISIFGMFIVNLSMFWYLIQARMERPYRDALAAITREPERPELMHDVWRHGKRFYYSRYAWSSLFSGANPIRFLREIAAERVKDDIKDTLRHYGVDKKLISLQMMAGYLQSQLASDPNLPVDFKGLMEKSINDFARHPWVQENGTEFLRIATESPENLHFPEWMSAFETYVKEYKR